MASENYFYRSVMKRSFGLSKERKISQRKNIKLLSFCIYLTDYLHQITKKKNSYGTRMYEIQYGSLHAVCVCFIGRPTLNSEVGCFRVLWKYIDGIIEINSLAMLKCRHNMTSVHNVMFVVGESLIIFIIFKSEVLGLALSCKLQNAIACLTGDPGGLKGEPFGHSANTLVTFYLY